jgi:hypothetical protein
MKSQRNVLKWIILDKFVVGFQIVEEGFFVGQVPVILEMVMDAQFLRV